MASLIDVTVRARLSKQSERGDQATFIGRQGRRVWFFCSALSKFKGSTDNNVHSPDIYAREIRNLLRGCLYPRQACGSDTFTRYRTSFCESYLNATAKVNDRRKILERRELREDERGEGAVMFALNARLLTRKVSRDSIRCIVLHRQWKYDYFLICKCRASRVC